MVLVGGTRRADSVACGCVAGRHKGAGLAHSHGGAHSVGSTTTRTTDKGIGGTSGAARATREASAVVIPSAGRTVAHASGSGGEVGRGSRARKTRGGAVVVAGGTGRVAPHTAVEERILEETRRALRRAGTLLSRLNQQSQGSSARETLIAAWARAALAARVARLTRGRSVEQAGATEVRAQIALARQQAVDAGGIGEE